MQSVKLQTGLKLNSFELKKMFIEKIFYLSESLILVVTRSLEFRVFYT
jgi:hypothetical protein